MSKCTCHPVPFEDCTTYGSAVEPGSAFEPNPDCREHFRRPPHRLADGSWSDGVDRTKPINFRQITGRFEVAVWGSPLLGVATKFVVWHKSTGLTPREFPTFEAAIAYADRAARGRA